jgi:hypothetical protein
MKILSELEVKTYLIKYLSKKDIVVIIDNNNRLVWNYNTLYSKFKITFRLEDGYNKPFKIRFYSSEFIKGLVRRGTLAKGSFGLNVYKTLQFIKPHLDKIADEYKIKTDQQNKYCTELESYYKKIHNRVEITVNKQDDNSINIKIIGYDLDNKTTYYYIMYNNNKYYLTSKIEVFEYMTSNKNLLETT